MKILAMTTLLILVACTTERSSRGRAPGGELSIGDFLDSGPKTGVDAAVESDSGRWGGEDAANSGPEAGGDMGPQCVPFDPPPAAGPCTVEAWECLVAANGDGAAFDLCFSKYPACDQCIADHFNDCLLGTIAEPGPCQQERFCFLGCLIHHCPEDDMRCLDAAVAEECSALAEDFNACGRDPDNENMCADFAITSCRPPAA